MPALDLSKILMFEFHYGYIYGNKINMVTTQVFTDPDSLMYELKTKYPHVWFQQLFN